MATGAAAWLVFFGVTTLVGIGLYLVSSHHRRAAGHGDPAQRRQPSAWLFVAAFAWAVVFALSLLKIAPWWSVLVVSLALVDAAVWEVVLSTRPQRHGRPARVTDDNRVFGGRSVLQWVIATAVLWVFALAMLLAKQATWWSLVIASVALVETLTAAAMMRRGSRR